MAEHAMLVTASEQLGMMSRLTKVLADHDVNITHVDLHIGTVLSVIYFEVTVPDGRLPEVLAGLKALREVEEACETPSSGRIYGKRVIVMGGGAQVGQVAMGAIMEADRHNIRGERISIDTIPLVGEEELTAAVLALTRLPRVKVLVLAGALMGGEIATAVKEVRANGVRVISLNMAGSVPEAADLVVSDPVQAGVMAVMSVADTAQFDLMRQTNKRY